MCIINQPPELRLRQTSSATPERFVAALTDFRFGRVTLFENSADEYLRIHRLGRSEADVTEGARGIWERLYYDWSDPNRVIVVTIDSNVWECGSSYTYTFKRLPNGTTDIDVLIAREGRNLKGCVLSFVLRTIGKRVLERGFRNTIKAIEARDIVAQEGTARGIEIFATGHAERSSS